ncbi:MAG: GIY-YIG nuclease family protein [Lachnospiraceae bacterium]|nr:GIY-YIG nuclease family protein [Lachnospiraceae bacterium]
MGLGKAYVYILKVSPDGVYKIGVSKDVEKRVKQLQTGNPESIEIVKKFLSNYPYKIESVMHRRFQYNHVQGECYYLSEHDIETFEESCSICETNFSLLEDIESYNYSW